MKLKRGQYGMYLPWENMTDAQIVDRWNRGISHEGLHRELVKRIMLGRVAMLDAGQCERVPWFMWLWPMCLLWRQHRNSVVSRVGNSATR